MQQPFKSHGPHCYLRSFQTNCKKCGAEVLYWECTHGSKLFFNYPPYGKLIRHHCKTHLNSEKGDKYSICVKSPLGLLIEASPCCPVCGKLFKNENSLKSHFNELKKEDMKHRQFFERGDFLNSSSESKFSETFNSPKFGKINIKEKKEIKYK